MTGPVETLGLKPEKTGRGLYGFLKERQFSNSPLGLGLRSLAALKTGKLPVARIELKEYQRVSSGADWALATFAAAADTIERPSTESDQKSVALAKDLYWPATGKRGYPVFGLMRYLASAPYPWAVASLYEPFAKLTPLDRQIAGALRARKDLTNMGLLAGLMLGAGKRATSSPDSVRNSLGLIGLMAGDAKAIEAALEIVENDDGGSSHAAAALTFLVGRGKQAVALAAARASCAAGRQSDWTALWLAEEEIAAGNSISARRLLKSLLGSGNSGLAERASDRLAELELAAKVDAVSVSDGKLKRARLKSLAAEIAGPGSDATWSAGAIRQVLEVLVTAFDLDDVEAFEAIVAVVRANPSAVPVTDLIMAALIARAPNPAMQQHETSDDGKKWRTRSLDRTLAATARALQQAGKRAQAYMAWLLVPDIVASEGDRLNRAFLALSLQRPDEALKACSELERVYRNELEKVAWPTSKENVVWPYRPMATAKSFDIWLPEGQEWPLITIVIPSFNQVKYVEETLLSIKNQDYPRLQVIICDAVSTDGTQDIIHQYKDVFDTIIIEKDRGQSDAINKGFKLAKGDLLHWLNTDDMLGPGSLYAVAAKYLEAKADIIAGFCVEVDAQQMLILNLPKATQDDFKVEELCKQFDRWLKGHFFYQPEVFFSRAIWEKTGAEISVGSNFAMDFDFWLRCAQQGATYDRLHWPVALFRKHAEQKTNALDDTIDEQAKMVEIYAPQNPAEPRLAQIRRRARRALTSTPRVAVVSKRFQKIFSNYTADELKDQLGDLGRVAMFADPADVDVLAQDLIIQLCHVQADYLEIESYRKRGYAGAVAGWFWDNHHEYFENQKTAAELDLVIAGHDFCRSYLKTATSVMLPSIALCTTQWTEREAEAFFSRSGGKPRSNELYGGFVRYATAAKRNRLIAELAERGYSDRVFLMSEANISRYFGLSRESRFDEWCSYKVSACLPVRRDLSQRFFDAWLTGQIPIIPGETADLLTYLPADVLDRHAVVFADYTADGIEDAHKLALHKFDSAGPEGILERHRMALHGHLFHHRIRDIFKAVHDFAATASNR
jgi:hypothetical protein